MIQKPRFFYLEELVPQELFDLYKDVPDKLWWCFDARIIWTADQLRYRYGKMIVNTWLWGGTSNERGLRLFNSETGSSLSQHKFGRALDSVFAEITAEEVRQDMFANLENDAFRYIRAIELDVPWLHFDVRNWIGPILTFSQ